jgi:hypothetical protein
MHELTDQFSPNDRFNAGVKHQTVENILERHVSVNAESVSNRSNTIRTESSWRIPVSLPSQ